MEFLASATLESGCYPFDTPLPNPISPPFDVDAKNGCAAFGDVTVYCPISPGPTSCFGDLRICMKPNAKLMSAAPRANSEATLAWSHHMRRRKGVFFVIINTAAHGLMMAAVVLGVGAPACSRMFSLKTGGNPYPYTGTCTGGSPGSMYCVQK
jgi:hypothetical protein